LQKPSYNTIRTSGLPARVVTLSEGLFQVSASYCKFHLNSTLDELEAGLLKDAESLGSFEAHSEKTLNLRKLKRVRDQIVPVFLSVLEHRLSIIRSPASASSAKGRHVQDKGLDGLSLVEDHFFERHQLLSGMAARCESQNNTEMHALRQRFSVLSGKAPFTNEELPLGPAALCDCLQEALQPLDIEDSHFTTLFGIYERRVMGNYRKLLEDCNAYLAGKGVLTNLNYTTYRNPELRHKKSAIARTGVNSTAQVPAAETATAKASAAATASAAGGFRTGTDSPPAHPKAAASGYRFEDFRELLSIKKQMFREMDERPGAAAQHAAHSVSASRDDINGILGELQRSANPRQGEVLSVQTIKQQIQAQLMNRSTRDRQLTLAAEDSDAIDMVGLLMDNALQNFKPNSATSQLMGMLQAPLVRVVLDDKSFFENHVHPARRMLDTLAETGMNWLDVADRDEKLYANVYDIVSGMSANFDGDSQTLLNAYEETNRLLQTLLRKAEAIERRQVEIAKGRERLSIARTRAEETMDALLAGRAVRSYTRSILQGAWTDVLVLTELRNGADSQNWKRLKETAESIIMSDSAEPGAIAATGPELAKLVLEALQLVGYNNDEAVAVTNRLLDAGTTPEDLAVAQEQPESASAQEPEPRQRDKPVYDLDAAQLALVDRIKSLPFGTWFDFQTSEWGAPERRKMAWVSHVTHHMLFVTARGQKAADMRIEDLAIAMSLGDAVIYEEDKRGFIQRALDSVYSSLKGILPGAGGERP
jgi:Protein of unknown function (DUF1631)